MNIIKPVTTLLACFSAADVSAPLNGTVAANISQGDKPLKVHGESDHFAKVTEKSLMFGALSQVNQRIWPSAHKRVKVCEVKLFAWDRSGPLTLPPNWDPFFTKEYRWPGASVHAKRCSMQPVPDDVL